MSIVQTTARVTRVRDLSPTAREITFTPERRLGFEAGAFVNVFVTVNSKEHRRAFSFSSDPRVQEEFTLTVRHVPDGVVSPYFWQFDVVGRSVKLMGPLGRNTADKLQKERVFLFVFGVGVSALVSG